MKQHLGRQSGVQNVEVSLLDGKVDITPKEDGQIDPDRLLKATYDSGVTVTEMVVTVRGRIVKDNRGGLALQVEPNRSFVIEANDLSKGLESASDATTIVTARGQLYKKPTGKKKAPAGPLKLGILEVQRKD